MTLQELITDARLQINAVGDTFWSDAEIVEYLNRSIDKLQTDLIRMKSSDIAKKVSFSTIIGKSDYWMNNYIGGIIPDGDLLEIIGIWRDSDSAQIVRGNLEQQSYAALNAGQFDVIYTNRTVGSYFYQFAGLGDNGVTSDIMTILPAPAVVEAFSMWYWLKIPYFSVTALSYTPTWLAQPFHDLLSIRASIRMLEKDDRDSSRKEKNFDQRLKEYKDYLKNKRSNAFSYEVRI